MQVFQGSCKDYIVCNVLHHNDVVTGGGIFPLFGLPQSTSSRKEGSISVWRRFL